MIIRLRNSLLYTYDNFSMSRKPKNIDIAHLAAYAEDPRSYCHYKGKPRSLHEKETRKKKPAWFPLRSKITQGMLLVSLLLLLFSGWCLWTLLA